MKQESVEPIPEPTRPGGRRKWSSGEVWEIRGKYNSGWTKARLCRHYGISRPTMDDMLHGRNAYRDV